MPYKTTSITYRSQDSDSYVTFWTDDDILTIFHNGKDLTLTADDAYALANELLEIVNYHARP